MQSNVQALLNAADPDQDFDLAKAMDNIAMLPVDNVYLRDERGQIQSTTHPRKFVVRFMVDADDLANPMLGNEDRKAIAGPFLMEHHGHRYHVYSASMPRTPTCSCSFRCWITRSAFWASRCWSAPRSACCSPGG